MKNERPRYAIVVTLPAPRPPAVTEQQVREACLRMFDEPARRRPPVRDARSELPGGGAVTRLQAVTQRLSELREWQKFALGCLATAVVIGGLIAVALYCVPTPNP